MSYDPITHYIPDSTLEPITIRAAINALEKLAKVTGYDSKSYSLLIRPLDKDEIEIVDFGKSSSFSTGFKKEEIDEIREETDSR
jgi:hypothetical protein